MGEVLLSSNGKHDFWLEKWKSGSTGFHQDSVNPYLPEHWPQADVDSGSTVLVPLCGKSRDMLWLQTPQWGRWLIASLLVTLALWIELRPEPTVDHPFAIIQILAGDEIGVANTEMRPVPRGLLD